MSMGYVPELREIRHKNLCTVQYSPFQGLKQYQAFLSIISPLLEQ